MTVNNLYNDRTAGYCIDSEGNVYELLSSFSIQKVVNRQQVHTTKQNTPTQVSQLLFNWPIIHIQYPPWVSHRQLDLQYCLSYRYCHWSLLYSCSSCWLQYTINHYYYYRLAVITRPPDGVLLATCSAPRLVTRAVITRPPDVVWAAFARCRFRTAFRVFRNSVTLARIHEWPWHWPWQKHSLGWHECVCQVWSRSAQPFGRPYGRQTNKHNAFYYIDAWSP